MYLVSVIIFMLFLVAISVFSGAPLAFVDFPSIIVIIGISLPIMLASGLMKDFIRSFQVMGSKDNRFTLIELKRSLVALQLMSKALVLGGAIGTITGIIGMLIHMTDPSTIGPSMALAFLTVFYALVLAGVLLPVQHRVRAILATFSERDPNE